MILKNSNDYLQFVQLNNKSFLCSVTLGFSSLQDDHLVKVITSKKKSMLIYINVYKN